MFPEVVVRDSLCCVLVLAREFYLTTSLSKSLLIMIHLAQLIHALSGIMFILIKIKFCSNIFLYFLFFYHLPSSGISSCIRTD